MLESVRNKLESIYIRLAKNLADILEVFVLQFGEENIDTNIVTFDKFLEILSSKTMGTMGIVKFSDSNSYGSYNINQDDYETNGRGKSLLEYIPDLGMLDYLTPRFEELLCGRDCYTITIHFPNVRITNEYDKFVDIQDLYAKVELSRYGKMIDRFMMTRTTFPFSHFKAGYAHSHLPSVYRDRIGTWEHPCLGTGPLNDTIGTLRNRYDLNIWGLFAFELSKYVTIESIAGTPYVRLETIGKGDIVNELNSFITTNKLAYNKPCTKLINSFIEHYALANKFKFKFVDGQYKLGESSIDACIHLSNEFISWYNSIAILVPGCPKLRDLKSYNILNSYIVSNGAIHSVSNNTILSDAARLNGKHLFIFRGEQINLRIEISEDMANNKSLLLTAGICSYIITNVLKIINFKYGKRKQQQRGSISSQNQTSSKSLIV